jgi:DNA (cytosine-5)-methyltransferase 1
VSRMKNICHRTTKSGPTESSALPLPSRIKGDRPLPQIISLFSGAGGLDLGFRERGFKIALAVDISAAAIKTHKRNFPRCHAVAADLRKLGPKGVAALAREQIPAGSVIGVIGGPPCQGFSRANTLRKRRDPRNALTSLYLRIVRRLQKHYTVEFVLFENVLGIRDRKNAVTFQAILSGLASLGFSVTEKELCALDFGVPQNRRRIVLSALREGCGYSIVRPRKRRTVGTVRDVIGELAPPAFYTRSLRREDIPVHPNHWTMQPKSPRFLSPDIISVDGRSFKRLSWSGTSPTIAFGNREIYIHPTGTRRISIYEAMLLQGFPSEFVLEGNLSEQVEQVSNAVPPPLARSVAAAVQRSMLGR